MGGPPKTALVDPGIDRNGRGTGRLRGSGRGLVTMAGWLGWLGWAGWLGWLAAGQEKGRSAKKNPSVKKENIFKKKKIA